MLITVHSGLSDDDLVFVLDNLIGEAVYIAVSKNHLLRIMSIRPLLAARESVARVACT
jgi:hypothetical protein